MPAGVQVESVDSDAPAAVAGLKPGDRLLGVNGRRVDDHLDVRFHADSGEVLLEISRGGERLELQLPDEDYPLRGIGFEDFRTKRCGCKCLFCFIDQLPEGVRPSLKIKDEDYRLSFLHGNYMTLNTLKDRDVDRILEQRLSPLYVSVHAVNAAVRAELLGREPKRPLIPMMERLLEGGIELYGQVVLCPEMNDGAVLDETIEKLASYHPGVRAIAVVPLGLSEHRDHDPRLRPVTCEVARTVLAQVDRHQSQLVPRLGTRFVWPGDEFFFKADLPIPPTAYYEGFEQYEDGIGMARWFMDQLAEELEKRRGREPVIRSLALATGTMFAPALEKLLNECSSLAPLDLKVIPVQNRYLGPAINVAGLLGGEDTARSLREAGGGRPAAIPAEMVSRANGLLLDDWTPDRVAQESGVPRLHVTRGAQGLVELLWEGRSSGEGAATYPHI